MAKLGSYRRIFRQDYSPENQDDFETLGITVNDSFESVYDCLTNQVTFTENINCTLVTFNVTLNARFVPTTPLVIKLNNFQKTINGIIPVNAVANNRTTLPDGGLFIAYTINNNTSSSSNITNSGNNASNPLTITINGIKGLPANTPFAVTALII
jgi:hypothetical protein